jgi:hypothetical protein
MVSEKALLPGRRLGSEIRPQIDPVIILVSLERQSAERKYIKLNQITED